MKDVNSVTLVCRLTKDPELRSLPSGTSVCAMRVAFSTSWKAPSTGEWEDRPNYCDVSVWGKQGESCATHLAKGRQVCVMGRLQWREWETQEGQKRQVIEIVADQVQFLGGKGGDSGGQQGSQDAPASASAPQDDFSTVPVSASEDDIPF